MSTVTLTSKSQMTLPRDVRDALGVGPGDKVDIIKKDGEFVLRRRRSAMELSGVLHRPGMTPLTIEEMDAAIGEAVAADVETSLARD